MSYEEISVSVWAAGFLLGLTMILNGVLLLASLFSADLQRAFCLSRFVRIGRTTLLKRTRTLPLDEVEEKLGVLADTRILGRSGESGLRAEFEAHWGWAPVVLRSVIFDAGDQLRVGVSIPGHFVSFQVLATGIMLTFSVGAFVLGQAILALGFGFAGIVVFIVNAIRTRNRYVRLVELRIRESGVLGGEFTPLR